MGTSNTLGIYLYKNILNNATPIVPKIYPNAKLFVNLISFNKSCSLPISTKVHTYCHNHSRKWCRMPNKQASISFLCIVGSSSSNLIILQFPSQIILVFLCVPLFGHHKPKSLLLLLLHLGQ